METNREAETQWEHGVLERFVQSALAEQRKSRQWGILFKILTFLYLFILLFIFLGWIGRKEMSTGEHTALIELHGVIASDSVANADDIVSGLQEAFKDKHTKGVILRINSPGGSPVQAGIINDEISRLRQLHPDVPLYSVVEDICASGGYYVAVAADRIYVDKASLVGSIGVLMDGFGFTGSMQKLGVERRLLTAGENKGFLDPFSPMNGAQTAYAKKMLGEIHGQFIAVVKKGRGTRLKEEASVFSGLVWTGQKSIELGLADALGSVDYVAREVIGAEHVVDFTPKENIVQKMARKFGVEFASGLLSGNRLR
jgi:protease-4